MTRIQLQTLELMGYPDRDLNRKLLRAVNHSIVEVANYYATAERIEQQTVC